MRISKTFLIRRVSLIFRLLPRPTTRLAFGCGKIIKSLNPEQHFIQCTNKSAQNIRMRLKQSSKKIKRELDEN